MLDLLSIEPLDEAYVRIRSERNVAYELSDHFTFKVPNHKFLAKKIPGWKGDIKLFNLRNGTIYKGLLPAIYAFAEERGYAVADSVVLPTLPQMDEEAARQYLVRLDPKFKGETLTPHPHQCKALAHAVSNGRCVLVSPTSSGKSLVIFGVVNHHLRQFVEAVQPPVADVRPHSPKILIIVPTVGLVTQLAADFMEYSSGRIGKIVHCIADGSEKNTNRPVVIATWQSVYRQQPKWFEQFHAVIVDEAHLAKATGITGILCKMNHCPFRYGLTGTLDGWKVNKLVLEGLFGPVFEVVTTKDLMEAKLVSELAIDCIVLKHSAETRSAARGASFDEETGILVSSQKRNDFLVNMAVAMKGNTLVLFRLVEDHGIPLYEAIKRVAKDRNVYLIHGGIKSEEREAIRQKIETDDNAIIVASYGTMSTGISIRRLHNIIFASPYKSRIKVLQSIGRQLRLAADKTTARLYDVSDDLRCGKWMNTTYRHFKERVKLYQSERFDHRIVRISL